MAASTLRRGDVAVIGYNTGASDTTGRPASVDSIQLLLLKPVGSGTTIFLTDRPWNGSAFVSAGGDGAVAFTAASDLAAGAVVDFRFSGGSVTISVNGTGTTVSAGGFDLEQNGDTVYVYQGSVNTPTDFLFAMELGDGNNTFNGSLANTGLLSGVHAVALDADTGAYHGPTTEAYAHLFNGERLLENIADFTNWNTDEHGGQKALDQQEQTGPYNVAPDLSLWLAASGGGNGIVSANVDATVGGGAQGHNLVIRYTNDNGDLVQTFASPRDIAFDTAEGKFFIIDSNVNGGTNVVLQGNIADLLGNPATPPTMTVLFSSSHPTILERQIRDMQVDTDNNIIYFTHGQRLEKIGYNTANQTSTVLAQLGGTGSGNPHGTQNSGFADDFVIDFRTGTVFFSAHRVVAAQDGDAVSRNYIAKITGLTPSSGANAFSWTGGQITTLPFSPDDDDTPHPLDIGTGTGEAFPQEKGTVEGLALSPDGGTLYFTTASILWDHDGDGGVAGFGGTPPQLKMGGVYSYALTGNAAGAYTQIWQQVDDGDTSSQAITAAGPQGLLDDIEVDPVTGQLYFLDLTGDQLVIGGVSQNPPGDEGVWRINPNGSGLTFVQAVGNINGLGAGSLFLNRAPTVTSSAQATPGVTEASAAPGSGATASVQPFLSLDVTDIETAGNPTQQLAGATVWISNNFQSGATHQDALTINGATSGAVNGIAYSYNAATGAMALTGASTFNNYEAAIALVRFNTSGDDPTAYGQATSRTISWAVSDGLNHSDPVSTTVTVTGINDAPVNNGMTGSFSGTEGLFTRLAGISFSDVDADPATGLIEVRVTVENGRLQIAGSTPAEVTAGQVSGFDTNTVTIISTLDRINATFANSDSVIYIPNPDFNGGDRLTIVTNDRGLSGADPGLTGNGTSEQDADDKFINIADVNDAPTVVNGGAKALPAILEDTPQTAANAPTVAQVFGEHFSDAADVQVSARNPSGSRGDTLAGIAITGGTSSAVGAWQYFNGSAWVDIGAASAAAAKTLTASTQLRFNPAPDQSGAAPQLVAHLVESSATSITNGATIDVPAGIDQAGRISAGTVTLSQQVTPVNDAPVNAVGAAVVIDEDAPATALTGVSVSDVDANPATDQVSVTLDVDHGTLAILTDVAGGVTAADIVSQDADTITLLATANRINATLSASGGLTYTVDADHHGADRLEVTTNDRGASGQDPGLTGDATSEQDVGSKVITVTSINDAPALPSGRSYAFSGTDEDTDSEAVPVSAILADAGASDIDGPASGIAVTAKAAALGGWEFSTDNGVNWTAFPAVSDSNALLLSADTLVRFTPFRVDGETATFSFRAWDGSIGAASQSGAAQTINIAASGGSTAFSSNSATATIAVSAVNDAPQIAALPSQTVEEDGLLTFGPARGNGIVVQDVDAGGGDLTASLNVETGTLALSGTTGLAVTGDGSGDVTLTGTAAAINQALDGLTYTPPPNADGDTTLTITVNDNGNAGGGGAREIVGTVAIDFLPVNDEPSGANKTVETVEDGVYTFAVADFGFTDVDGDALLGVKITTLPSAGELRLDGGAVAAGATVSASDIAAGKLTFAPSGSGSPYASFTFQVQDDGGATSGSDLDSTPNTITFDVEVASTAPAGADTTLAVVEDGLLALAAADFGFSDGDGDAFAGVVVVTAPGSGALTLDGSAVQAGQFISAADIDAGKVVFAPEADEYGAGYASFTFQVKDTSDANNQDPTPNTIDFDVTPVEDEASGTLTVTGAAEEGGTLTAALTDVSDADGATMTAYRWQELVGSDWVPLAGEDEAIFAIQSDQSFVGRTVRVVATTADALGGTTAFEGPARTIANVNVAPDDLSLTGGTVAENALNGTLVGTVTGADDDGDTLSYSLVNNAGGRFAIDAASGRLTVLNGALLNYEVARSHDVVVKVTDTAGESYQETLTIELTNVVETQTFTLTTGADTFTASSDDHWVLNGLAGNDSLTTLGGADIVRGNAGDDTISTGAGNDIITFFQNKEGFDAIDGGAGADRVNALANGTVIGLRSIANVEVISANGYNGVSIAGSSAADTLDFTDVTLTGINRINLGAGDDTILGSSAADYIIGGAGNDVLNGGGGDDTFEIGSGAGADIIDGGAGTDRIGVTTSSFTWANITGVEALAGTSLRLNGTSAGDLLDFSAVTLTGVSKIYAGAGDDTVIGSAGADVLDRKSVV